MGTRSRSPKPSKAKRPLLPRHFYIEDTLYKKLHINRSKDLLRAWDYLGAKQVLMSYSATLDRQSKAWTNYEVAELLDRSIRTIENIFRDDKIERPIRTYSIETGKPYQYFWSEKDIFRLRDYLAELHRGRPRNDGIKANNDIPSLRELRAKMRGEKVMYVKEGEEFIPTWRAI